MQSSRIPSPARSQGTKSTPRRYKPCSSRSVCSPARSHTSLKLSTVIQMDSFELSPMPTRRSVLTDTTHIDIPARRSWWKKLDENSREIMEVLNNQEPAANNNAIEEYIDVDVVSQEKKNYTLDLPESSDGESICSIVIPQRKLFTQKENQPQNTFGQIIDSRESLAKLQKSQVGDERSPKVNPKNLFNLGTKQRRKPIFPSGLLNFSVNKITRETNKTKELTDNEVKGQVKSLFGSRPGMKRKNMFADFIASESEDDIPEIQPKVFGFQNDANLNRRDGRDHSPSSVTDNEMDDWRLLPSSTMVDNQLEEGLRTTPSKRSRLSKLTDAVDFDTSANNKQNKSFNSKNKSKHLLKFKELKMNELIESKASDDQLVAIVDNQNHSNGKSVRNISLRSFEKQSSKINKLNESKNAGQMNEIVSTHQLTNNRSNKSAETSRNIKSKHSENSITKIDQALESDDEEDFTLEYENDDNEQAKETNDITIVENETLQPQQNLEYSTNNSITEQHHESNKQMKQKELDQKSEQKNISSDKNYLVPDGTDIADDNGKADTQQTNISLKMGQKDQNKSNNISETSKQVEAYDFVNTNGQNQATDLNPSEVNNEPKNTQDEQQNSQQELNVANVFEEIQCDNQMNISEKSSIHKDGDQEYENKNDEKANEKEQENSQNTNVSKCNQMNVDYEHENQEIIGNDCQNDNPENKNDKEKEKTDYLALSNGEHNREQEVTLIDSDRSVSHDTDVIDEEMEEDNENDNEEDAENEEDVETENDNEEDAETENVEDAETENEDAESENEEDAESENEEDAETEKEENAETELEEGAQIENELVDDQGEIEKVENEDEEINNDEQAQESSDSDIDRSDDGQNTDNQGQDSAEEGEESNATHERTGQFGNKHEPTIASPEMPVLSSKMNQMESFTVHGRNTSVRKTKSMFKSLNLRPSLAPVRENTGQSDGTRNSSAEGSGWDSHRTTRVTLRKTFGKDFTPRKSLRTLVMEQSAKRQTNVTEGNAEISKHPLANSTEMPEPETLDIEAEADAFDVQENRESENAERTRIRQSTLEMYLSNIRNKNIERKKQLEEEIRSSLKAPSRDVYNPFKVPAIPKQRRSKTMQNKAKAQRPHGSVFPRAALPAELLEDMQYKPPKRYRPPNASWITKRLYKFLESKLEPKYDYKARVRSEKLVEQLYEFTRAVRRQRAAPPAALAALQRDLARLRVVTTHFDFNQFFHDFMPREVRLKVVPDAFNNLPEPKHGVFSDILR